MRVYHFVEVCSGIVVEFEGGGCGHHGRSGWRHSGRAQQQDGEFGSVAWKFERYKAQFLGRGQLQRGFHLVFDEAGRTTTAKLEVRVRVSFWAMGAEHDDEELHPAE